MKLKKSFRLIALANLVITSTFLFSCKKEALKSSSPAPVSTNEVSVKNGMLVFKDSTTFEKVTDSLMKMGNVQLDAWESKLSGFESYRKIFEDLDSEFGKIGDSGSLNSFLSKNKNLIVFNPDTSLSYALGSPRLAIVSNKDGRFMVGSQLHIVTKDKWIVVKNPTQENINSALSTRLQDNSKGIYVNPLKSVASLGSASGLKVEAFDPSAPYLSPGMVYEQIWYNTNHDRRLYVQYFIEAYPNSGGGTSQKFYVGLKEQSFGGLFGTWSDDKTNYVQNYIEYNMIVEEGGGSIPDLTLQASGGYYSWSNVTGYVYYDVIVDPNVKNFHSVYMKGYYTSGGLGYYATAIYQYNTNY
jgi:hypothetical protein